MEGGFNNNALPMQLDKDLLEQLERLQLEEQNTTAESEDIGRDDMEVEMETEEQRKVKYLEAIQK